jgi:hypothetical protein
MEPDGVYLHCFARAGPPSGPSVVSVAGGQRVASLEAGKVRAVFSRVPLDDFRAESPAPRSEDPEWVVSRVCQHQRVVEETMRSGPVLPVRFGTVFSSEQALLALMVRREGEIVRILDRLADKEEWAVKGFVDAAKAREWLLATDPVLAERRRSTPPSPGQRYLHENRIEAEVDKALWPWRAAVAEEIQGRCRGHGVAARPLKLQPRNVSGHDADMVLALALLVERAHVAALEACVRQLGAEYADRGILLELSGPWPPYSFCPPPEGDPNEASPVLHSA